MPLYDLRCKKCGKVFMDVLVKNNREHYSPACPLCHTIGSLEKLPSSASFVVKGFNAKNRYSGGGDDQSGNGKD